MKALISFEQALQADKLSQKKYAVPAAVLMERAGMGCAHVLLEDLRAQDNEVSVTTVVAVCGASNNGGDAQVVLREMHARGAKVRALFVKEVKSDLARVQYEVLQSLGIPCAFVAAAELHLELSALSKHDYIIDGISGVGLRGAYREPAIITAVNEGSALSGARVIAIDVPSGMISKEPLYGGEALPIVNADITASIGLRKLPLYFPSFRKHCGSIVDVENVFPVSVVSSDAKTLCADLGEPVAQLLEHDDLRTMHTVLERDVYKNKRGAVAVVAGSEKSPGAAFLALEAATRGSAGVVYGAFDETLAAHAALSCPPAVVGTDGLSEFIKRVLSKSLAIDAWLVGCGWGTRDLRILADICAFESPVVCDADALAMLAMCSRENSTWQHVHQCPKILTPHVGELYTLQAGMAASKKTNKGIRCFETAQAVAAHYNAVVIAKNSVSYIAHPSAHVPYVIDGRVPILATGGSGDVLAGFLASLVACEYSHFVEFCREQEGEKQDKHLWHVLHTSAAYAALTHLEAGRCLERTGGSGNASDIIKAISALHTLV